MKRDRSPVSLLHRLQASHAGALRIVGALGTGVLAAALAACGGDHTSPPEPSEAGPMDAGPAANLCDIDAFTGVGTACPMASALVCFPECEAGGCTCEATAAGPRWACVTDRSCLPSCAPIDDACAEEAGADDALDGDAPSE
jgi:hypothetical protein